jgi:hypothetical protein
MSTPLRCVQKGWSLVYYQCRVLSVRRQWQVMDRAVGRFTSTLLILLSLTFGIMHHLSQPKPAIQSSK